MNGGLPQLGLRFDLRAPDFGARPDVLYGAAIDMAEWADRNGFQHVRISEHHGSADGYCPAPLAALAAFAARTSRLRLRVSALILPLHDPLRVAEELAVIDIISKGRAEVVVAAGYRRREFDMFGADFAARGAALEAGIALLRRAWSGEPVEWRGRTVRVLPVPVQPGGLPIFVGGSSRTAARRAARLGDGFMPTDPALYQLYRQECVAAGRDPGPKPGPAGPFFLHVTDDPPRARAQLDRHVRHEIASYAEWTTGDQTGADNTPQPVWATGDQYAVLTPAEAVSLLRELGPSGALVLHPLVAGLDPRIAWESLDLIAGKVLPALQAEGNHEPD